MSRPTESTFRIALRAIALYSTDPQARELALEVLAGDVPRPPASSPQFDASGAPLTDAERARRYRQNRHGVTAPVTENVTIVTDRHVTRHGDRHVTAPLSCSPSLSEVSDKKEILENETEERERASVTIVTDPVTAVTKSVTASRDASRTIVTLAATRTVSLTDPLPDELRAAASIIGLQDIDTAWTKFVGHYDGRTLPVSGWWQKWCADEKKRERAPASGTRRTAPPVQPTGEGGKRLWKVGGGA